MRRYGRARQHAVRQGFVSEQLDAQQVRALVPLAGDNVVGGYLHRFGGHANPQRTVQAYAWAMQDHGGRMLQHTTVLGFTTAGGKVTEVRTDRGDVRLRHAGDRRRPADQPCWPPSLGVRCADGRGARRDDRHRAAAADADRRRRRQRPLRPADAARQSRLWRRPARMAGDRRQRRAAPLEHAADAQHRRAASPSCSRGPRMRA